MMKMTAKLFGVLCAASLVFCAACDGIGNKPEDENNEGKDKTELDKDKDNNGDSDKDNDGKDDGKDKDDLDSNGDKDKDNGGKEEDEVSYAVGSTVTISGVKYLVIRNTAKNDADAGRYPSYGYYPNARADEYRDYLIEMYDVKEPYVLVFNTETTKTGTSSFDDDYRILRGGAVHYRIRYRWESLIRNIAALTADDLRKGYDPSCFVIDNSGANYGSDLSKKFFRTYRFNYDNGGTTITYRDDKWRLTDEYFDYVYVGGKERNQYAITDMISSHARSYILRNPNNTSTDSANHFFEFRVDFEEDTVTPRLYRLIANGKGTVEGGTNNKLYQRSLYISKLRYYSENRDVCFNVDGEAVSFDDLYEREESDEPGDDSGSGDDGNDNTGGDTGSQAEGGSAGGTKTVVVKNKGVGKYVTVSETTKIVNEISVPEMITFSVPFADEHAPMSEFTKVTFVPIPYNDEVKGKRCVIFVPKTGSKTAYEFIDNFKAGYGIFGDYTWTKPVDTPTPSTDSSVTLQDDAAAKADTSTARFNFTGKPVETGMYIDYVEFTKN